LHRFEAALENALLNALAVILANFGDTPQTTETFLGFGVYVIVLIRQRESNGAAFASNAGLVPAHIHFPRELLVSDAPQPVDTALVVIEVLERERGL